MQRVKDAKKFDIQKLILGNLLTQVNANQVSNKRIKELLANIKDDEIQRRLDELKRDANNNNDDDDNINFYFNDGDDDDNDDDMDADDLLRKYDILRRHPVPKPRPQKYEDELLHRYNRLKLKTDENDLLRKFDRLKKTSVLQHSSFTTTTIKRKRLQQ